MSASSWPVGPQLVCAEPQSGDGKTDVITPMSVRSAPAIWCLTAAWPAFQPKRPRRESLVTGSVTTRKRPEMPSPFASSGSASAITALSGIASSRPMPTSCGETRAEYAAGVAPLNDVVRFAKAVLLPSSRRY